MHTGMLWFDNSNKSLAAKIQKAMEYYEKKYERKPDLCLVNPSMFEKMSIEGVEVRFYRPVLPGHIWIGVRESEIDPVDAGRKMVE